MNFKKIIFYINLLFVASNIKSHIKSYNKQNDNQSFSHNNQIMNLTNETFYNIIIYDYFLDYNYVFYLITGSTQEIDIGSEMLLDLSINKTNETNKYIIEEIKVLAKKDFNCDFNLEQYYVIFDNMTTFNNISIFDIISIKIKNITILKKEINLKINFLIKKEIYFVPTKVCRNELEYNTTDYYYIYISYFFDYSQIYLYVSPNFELTKNVTLTIIISIYYRIIDYNFESKPSTKIINTTANMINGSLSYSYEFYANFEDQFNINQTSDNYFVANIIDITAENYYKNNITNDIDIIFDQYEIYVGDYYNSYKPMKYNNKLGINNYKGLSSGIIIVIVFGELGFLVIIAIIVYCITKYCNCDNNTPEDQHKSQNITETNITENCNIHSK